MPDHASAIGTPFNAATWTGVRATLVKDTGNPPAWHVPDTVEARWTVPCLPTAVTGVPGGYLGAYDQWIGLEDRDGSNLIQVGIRSYHIDTGFGGSTGYFAWMLNTRGTNGRNLVMLSDVRPQCHPSGQQLELPEEIITARVQSDGRVCLTRDREGSCLGGRATRYSGPGLAPGRASLVVERFAGGYGHLPWFGATQFRDAKALYGFGFPTLGIPFTPGVWGGNVGDTTMVRASTHNAAATGIDAAYVSWPADARYGRFWVRQPPLTYPGDINGVRPVP